MNISEARRLIQRDFRHMNRIVRRRVRRLGISLSDSARVVASRFHYGRTGKILEAR